ncbi:MAG TPA: PhoH family protein [Candidatus Krumholzibacteria bacterium]|nr:PhoH family protein [Candidatus Krumholzibacteria bacterium]
MATFILDTNVLLHDAQSLYAFKDATVVVPLDVLEELDLFKKNVDEMGRNAREVIRELDRLRQGGSLPDGVPVNGGTLRVLVDYLPERIPQGMDLSVTDNRILLCAKYLEEAGEQNVVVVSKDINARVKGDALGITTQDFEVNKIKFDELYKGWAEIEVPSAALAAFYSQGFLEPRWPALANQCFILRDAANAQKSAIAICCNGRLEPLRAAESHPWGVRPLNVQQKFALELLLAERLQLVTLVGGAGTGKTLLALAAGLQKVMEERAYGKVFVSRPIMPLGRDIGYLPGSKDEKLESWMQPIYDNLKLLTGSFYDDESKLSYLFDTKVLELEAVTYIRGRSLPRQFIIIDEAQNLTPHEIKTIISRAGQQTKVILTGDPFQIDNPYLDASSNGLTYAVERFKGQEIFGHVMLTRSERSPLAALAVELL